MAYSASNAATEIIKQIGTKLDSAGYSSLKNAANGSPPTGFDIKVAQAPIDGWLKPATEPQATIITPSSQTISATSFTTITSSAWSVTPYAPRAHLLTVSFSGYNSGGEGKFTFQIRYDGGAYGIGQFYANAINTHLTFPTLFVLLPAADIAYPLVAKTIDIQLATDGTAVFNIDTGDTISYSIS